MWYLYCVLKHCIFVTYACASPEPVISKISAILRSFCRLCGTYCYEIQRDTVIKTRHRSIALWYWHSQRMNFRKGSGFKHTLIAPYHSRSTKRNVKQYFKAEGNNSITQSLTRFLFNYITTQNRELKQTRRRRKREHRLKM